MINAKLSDIRFDDLGDDMNNQDMVAIEHEIVIKSEKETITVLIYWGYHQLRLI